MYKAVSLSQSLTVGSMEGHCSYGLQAVKAEEVSQEEPVLYAEQSSQQSSGQCSQHQLDPRESCGPAQVFKRRMPKWGRAVQSSNVATSSTDTRTTDCTAEEGMSHTGSVRMD